MSGALKLPRHLVDWLVRGALAAASKDDVTPLLCAVKWTVGDGRVTVIATDRYRVHQLHVPAPEGAPDGSFLMDRFQADTLLKLRHSYARSRAGEVVELTWTDAEPLPTGMTGKIGRRYHGTIRIDIPDGQDADADLLSYEAAQVRGNYPPLERLFDDAYQGEEERLSELLLTPEYLSAVRHLRTENGGPLRFTMPRKVKGNKLGAMQVSNHQDTARALIQPHAPLFTGKEYGRG